MATVNYNLSGSSKTDVKSIDFVSGYVRIYLKSGGYYPIPTNGQSLDSLEMNFYFSDGWQTLVFLNNPNLSSYDLSETWLLGTPGDDMADLSESDIDLTLSGGNGDDILITGSGDDVLNGGVGDDVLNGGSGNDILDGGLGTNTFIFNKGDGEDIIVSSDAAYSDEYVDQKIIKFNDVNSTDVYFTFDKGSLFIHYGNNDTVEIEGFVTFNNNNVAFEFADRTISAQEVDEFVGVQYWVRNIATNASYDYSTTIYYNFPTTAPSYVTGAQDLNQWAAADQQMKDLYLQLFQEISKYTKVTFIETNDVTQPNVITIQANSQASSNGSAGYAYLPWAYYNSKTSMDVYIDHAYKYVGHVGIHEIGHALGLSHTFDGRRVDSLSNQEDTTAWSRMSYNTVNGDYWNGYDLRNFDIAGLQAIYGVNETYNAGNNVYTFNANIGVLVSDGAGIDTIDASGAGDSAYINLAEGAWSYIGVKSQHISSGNQLSINLHTKIENAVGSAYNDVIKGNYLDNHLFGGAGDDLLDGGFGADIMYGGTGDDTYYVDNVGDKVIELASEGYDTVISSVNYSLVGTHVEKLQLTGTANLNATGNSLGNHLIGNSGNNILNGMAGADRMEGGKGDDTYYVDNVKDKVVELANEGYDTVISSVSYSLVGGYVERLELTGLSDLDATGNSLSNHLIGNAGNNILNGMTGADRMEGGKGNDTYYVDNVNDQVIEFANEGIDHVISTVSHTLSAHVENLTLQGIYNISATGNDLNNILVGNSGNNILRAMDGNDILDGGLGADIMYGGTGDDTYYVDNINDKAVELANQGYDTVISSVSYSLTGGYVEKLVLTGSSNLNATGNSLANHLIGNEGNNILNGMTGADRMEGGKGNDTYYVDNVNDQVIEFANEGIDHVISTVSHTLSAHVENLTLQGTSNISAIGNDLNNILVGNTGNNILRGMDGDDILDGGLGADIMYGGTGNDTYYVDNVNDKVVELSNEGYDTVISSVTYSLTGGHVEKLVLTGSSDLNATGNSLANTLVGNSGNNTLNGGAGNDILTGGAGSDTAIYTLLAANDARGGNGSDTWTDFTVGQVGTDVNADKIDISSLLVGYSGNYTLAELEQYITVKKSGNDTLFYIDRDGSGGSYSDTLLLTLNNTNTTLDELIRNGQITV